MTKEELNTRIEGIKTKIEKINKRISKWENKRDSDSEFKKEYGWLSTYENRKGEFKQNWIEDCNYEIRRANNDLKAAQATLEKYQNQLDKLNEFNASEKIEIIWNFLQEWKKQAHDYYVKNAEYYYDLKQNENQEYEEYKKTNEYKNRFAYFSIAYKYNPDFKVNSQWRNEYYHNVDTITRDLYIGRGKLDEERLNKLLDKDVQTKYENLIKQVTAKAGNIQDASGLYIDQVGNIAGVIVGDKAKVRLWTTLSAIDSDYMCPHYRSYCNVVD